MLTFEEQYCACVIHFASLAGNLSRCHNMLLPATLCLRPFLKENCAHGDVVELHLLQLLAFVLQLLASILRPLASVIGGKCTTACARPDSTKDMDHSSQRSTAKYVIIPWTRDPFTNFNTF